MRATKAQAAKQLKQDEKHTQDEAGIRRAERQMNGRGYTVKMLSEMAEIGASRGDDLMGNAVKTALTYACDEFTISAEVYCAEQGAYQASLDNTVDFYEE